MGLGLTAWPRLLAAAPQRPLEAGVVDAVLCAVQLLAVVGFLTPVRMLPLLVFEVLWKAVWLLSVAVPLWVQGGTTDGLAATAFACAWASPSSWSCRGGPSWARCSPRQSPGHPPGR